MGPCDGVLLPAQWTEVQGRRRLPLLLLPDVSVLLLVLPVLLTPAMRMRVGLVGAHAGRGDRRVSQVIRRAWEKGALNDAWCVIWQAYGGGGGSA